MINKIQPENLNNIKLKKKRKKRKHRQSSSQSICSTNVIKTGKVVVKKRLSIAAILVAILGLSTTATVVALDRHNAHQEEIKKYVVTNEYKLDSLMLEKVLDYQWIKKN